MRKTTLYVGLFDKETKRQRIGTVEAYKVAENITMSIVDGATISEASGIYKHDDGSVIIEPSLRIELLDATAEQVAGIVGALKHTLNQESVLVEQNTVSIKFA